MKLQTIKRLFNELNRDNFDGKLDQPVIKFTRGEQAGMHFSRNNGRSIMYFNPFLSRGEDEMRATIFHEMVHQYLDMHLGADDNDDHGDLFWLAYFTHITPNIQAETPYEGKYRYV